MKERKKERKQIDVTNQMENREKFQKEGKNIRLKISIFLYMKKMKEYN